MIQIQHKDLLVKFWHIFLESMLTTGRDYIERNQGKYVGCEWQTYRTIGRTLSKRLSLQYTSHAVYGRGASLP